MPTVLSGCCGAIVGSLKARASSNPSSSECSSFASPQMSSVSFASPV